MNTTVRWMVTGLLAASLFPGALQAARSQALESAEKQLRDTSLKVLDLFRDTELVAPRNTGNLVDRLHEILDQRFDWVTMAKWVLGRQRSAFDERQTEQFSKLFSQYVVLYYLAQVEEYVVTGKPEQVDSVKIDFRDARERRDGAVAMDVVFVTPRGTEVQTGYTLVRDARTDEWQVRNFIVEGVSLVRNWRTQLARVRSPEEIISIMRGKVEELRGKRQTLRKEDND